MMDEKKIAEIHSKAENIRAFIGAIFKASSSQPTSFYDKRRIAALKDLADIESALSSGQGAEERAAKSILDRAVETKGIMNKAKILLAINKHAATAPEQGETQRDATIRWVNDALKDSKKAAQPAPSEEELHPLVIAKIEELRKIAPEVADSDEKIARYMKHLEVENDALRAALADREKEHDEELAICQMQTVNAVMRHGGMNPDEAIHQLDLDYPKYLALAEKENLDWIADLIRAALGDKEKLK